MTFMFCIHCPCHVPIFVRAGRVKRTDHDVTLFFSLDSFVHVLVDGIISASRV